MHRPSASRDSGGRAYRMAHRDVQASAAKIKGRVEGTRDQTFVARCVRPGAISIDY